MKWGWGERPTTEEERELVRELGERVRSAMEPYKAEDVILESIYDIDFDKYFMHVKIKGLEGWRQVFALDPEDIYLWPTQIYARELGQMFAKAFRKRQVEPEENFELGEN